MTRSIVIRETALSDLVKRCYDKGERRHKHVHSAPEPCFVVEHGNPKRVIGKCPRGMSAMLLDRLINEAIPPAEDLSGGVFHKRLYVVHDGAVYETMSSDRGRSYHGYPYRGRLSSSTIGALRRMAAAKGCLDGFERWVDEHIEPHGRRA